MSSSAATYRRGLVLADLIPAGVTREAGLVASGAAFTGLMAQLSVHIPGTPVPVTGQTFAALLVGAVLGPRRALAGMAIYVLAGVAGVPWFAGGSHGAGGASFGYVLGFLLASSVVGWCARRGGDRTPLRMVATMVLGSALIYAVGVPWLAATLHVSLARAVSLGVTPFLVGDALKVALAAGLLPAAWRLTRR